MVDTVGTCPLGSHCERIVGDKLERCMWYVTLSGCNPQTGEHMENVSKCAMAWIPILQVNVAGVTDRVADAVNRVETAVVKTNPIQIIADPKLIEAHYDQIASG